MCKHLLFSLFLRGFLLESRHFSFSSGAFTASLFSNHTPQTYNSTLKKYANKNKKSAASALFLLS